jgi:hypothetical protein
LIEICLAPLQLPSDNIRIPVDEPYVAQMAGMPNSIVLRNDEVLHFPGKG